MRTLEEVASAGKWRYVLYVVAHAIANDPTEERIRYFSSAIDALRGSKKNGTAQLASSLLFRYAVATIRRDRTDKLRCIISWLCLFPGSAAALRALASLARKTPGMESIFLASMQLLPLEKIRKDDRTQLCRALLTNGKGFEAAAVAKKILQLNPESAEARHLLWSALLQTGKDGEKLFTARCE